MSKTCISASVLSFAVFVVAPLLGQKKQPAPPPIVPISINEGVWNISSDIEFVLQMGGQKGKLSINAPGWLEWTVSSRENTLEINSLTQSAVAKLALLKTFMVGWVAATENTEGGIRIAFEKNVRVRHRQNGNQIVVDLEKLPGKRKKRRKKN